MSVHQRIKVADDQDIIHLKKTAYNILNLVLLSSTFFGSLVLIYIIKSAMGIDLIPGWSLIH